ncbi:MAG: carboxymuconolactone decarboxylase family protein [Acidimicrobiales bacterium]|jgi:alkyl hydroperoxide reductase subunit D
MGVPALKEALPPYAKDIRLNLDSTIAVSTLPERRLWGAVLATAIASRGRRVLVELAGEAREHLTEEAFEAAKAAAAVMAMNNVYYRSKHLLADEGEKGYEDIPARLRMQVIGTHGGVDPADFEFWCLAVSAVNGCGGCLAAHERAVRELGVGRDQVHEALRIASVVHAVAVTLESEEMTAEDAIA